MSAPLRFTEVAGMAGRLLLGLLWRLLYALLLVVLGVWAIRWVLR